MTRELWTLPESWRWSRTGEIGEIVTGATPPTDNDKNFGGNTPFFKPTDLNAGYFLSTARESLSTEGATIARLLPSNSVLVTCIGATIGKTALARVSGATNQQINAVLPGRSIALPEWIYWWFTSPMGQDLVRSNASATTIPILNKGRFAELPVPIAPVGEQRRIVAKTEALTSRSRRAKEALDAIPALLERFRQAVLAAAFRGDLTADWREKNPDVEPAEELLKRIRAERRRRWEEAELAKMRAKGKVPGDDRWKERYEEPPPVDASELPELPEGWEWATWAQVGLCQNGRPFPSSEYAHTGIKLLRPGNLHVAGGLEWTTENTKYLPEGFAEENPDHIVGPHELVMNLTAQSLKDEFLGRICLSPPNERCLLNQRLARLTPTLLPARFFLWLFKSPLVRSYINELNTGSLIQHMFTSQVEQFTLPIPPLAEQFEVARRIDTMLESVNRVRIYAQEGAHRLKQLDSATLAKAFRGELVHQDPNDEPASALLERIRAEATPSGEPTNGARRPRKPAPSESSKPSTTGRGRKPATSARRSR
ncbi:restriction endonuclease subunit S [Sorangium sp. So ce1389]|uniref:restriction endonuclease subunit S n=1 Tax=Sorangium sp. So ce1389 TaxID=3133336 RepID=UPI003F5DC2F1